MEISEHFEQLFIRLINSPDKIAHLILFEILSEGFETMLHELINLNGVMILVTAMNSQAQGADQATILTVGIDTDKGWVLLMCMAVVWAYELLE